MQKSTASCYIRFLTLASTVSAQDVQEKHKATPFEIITILSVGELYSGAMTCKSKVNREEIQRKYHLVEQNYLNSQNNI